MEVTEKYTNLKERAERIVFRENQKLEYGSVRMRMLHDNFDDPDWKHGDPIVGTMIFTDEPEPVVEVLPVRDLTAEEIDLLKTDIQIIKERLGIL